ncbi:MAG: hypothetical protein JWQ66_190, partial [Mucilaginibacter sp.]|nr:hypothetical protein [Mucilaginibacter sp.]
MNTKKTVVFFSLILIALFGKAQTINEKQEKDWLINNKAYVASIKKSESGKDIILSNGLVKRVFRIQPNVTCISYENLSSGQQLLRNVKPEAVLTIDGKKINIGGLYGQKEQAYLLPEWIGSFTENENDFQFQSYSVSEIQPYIKWKQTFWAGNIKKPTGKVLTLNFQSNLLKGIDVAVHYELYDGIPLIVKSLSVINNSDHSVIINKTVNEI